MPPNPEKESEPGLREIALVAALAAARIAHPELDSDGVALVALADVAALLRELEVQKP